MQGSDETPFVQRLVILAELFSKPLSPAVQVLYFEALQDLDLAVVMTAMHAATRTCTFMPKPAELRALACGDDEDAAERAWLEYKRLARAIGGYDSPVVDDPALADALVAIFGSWEAACWTDLTPEMWANKRKEFGRVYRAMRHRPMTAPRKLLGFVERDNELRGFRDQPLVRQES